MTKTAAKTASTICGKRRRTDEPKISTDYRDLEYISDVYSIFGLCLSGGNCQANSYQAPFDAATQVFAKDINMGTVAQSEIRHGGSSLCGRGHRVKSFDPRNHRSVHSLAAGRSVPSSLSSIDRPSIELHSHQTD
jgi:hypothetical protein